MDANSGEPWSEMDIKDLRASLDFGNTYADAARMLCRDEDEVRQKAKELGLFQFYSTRTRHNCRIKPMFGDLKATRSWGASDP
jgi:hypothetical protein